VDGCWAGGLSAEVAAGVDLLVSCALARDVLGGCGLGSAGGERGALVVEALALAARRLAERVGSVEAVAVPICRDGPDLLLPGGTLRRVARRHAETRYPRLVLLDGVFGERVGALFDQVAEFAQGPAHFGGHRSGGLGDEPGEVAGAAAWSGATGACSGVSVVLGGLGDCLVLRGELADARPGVLLGGDRLVCGAFGALVLQDAAEDAACREVPGLEAGGVLVVLEVRLVGRDIRCVGLPAAGHGYVERLSGRRGGVDEQVRGVDGRAVALVGAKPVVSSRALRYEAGEGMKVGDGVFGLGGSSGLGL
jgi:hypothetical protein